MPRTVTPSGPQSLVRWSEDISNVFWLKSNAALTASAPSSETVDGRTMGVCTLNSTSNIGHYMFPNVPSQSLEHPGEYITFGGYFKKGTCNVVNLLIVNSYYGGVYGEAQLSVNLTTGAAVSYAKGVGYGIRDVGGGWWRIYLVAKKRDHGYAAGDNKRVYCGELGTIYVTGLQVTKANHLGPYIKTTTGTVTTALRNIPAPTGRTAISPSVQNLVRSSEDMSHASWTSYLASVTVALEAAETIDGKTMTVNKLTQNAASGIYSSLLYHNSLVPLTFNRSPDVTYSAYVKAGTSNTLLLYVHTITKTGSGVAISMNVNVSGRTATLTNAASPYAKLNWHEVRDVGGGWVKATFSLKLLAEYGIYHDWSTSLRISPNGGAGTTVYVTGVQATTSNSLGAYVKTTGTEAVGSVRQSPSVVTSNLRRTRVDGRAYAYSYGVSSGAESVSSPLITIPNGTAITCEAWVKERSMSSLDIGKSSGALLGFNMDATPSSYIDFLMGDLTTMLSVRHVYSGTLREQAGPKVNLPTSWTHVVMVYSPTRYKVYVNGLLAYENTHAYALLPSPYQGYFRAFRVDSSYPCASEASMCDVRLYNRELSASEVADRCFDGRDDAAMRTSLVVQWLGSEGTGSTIADSSGNGNVGTFSGTPKWFTEAPFK